MRDIHSIVVFAEIERFPGYRFGSDGSVWKYIARRWRELRGSTDKHGYRVVTITVLGSCKKYLVHRLILEAFIGMCPNEMQGCHRNDAPSDNRLSNLRWDKPAGNAADKITNGIERGHKERTMSTLTEEKVIRLRKDYADGMTPAQLAVKYDISRQHAHLAASHKIWKSIG